MPRRTVILVPPSEGKADGGDGPPWSPGRMAFPDLDEARAELLAAAPSTAVDPSGPTVPAIERYTGVLYKELDAPSLRGQARRRLDRDLVVVSGLWGLVAPRDPIPTYRLKMSASLPGTGRLSTWWRPTLTAALAPRVRGAEVWDLLPNEHAAALDWDALAPARRTTIRFLDPSGRVVAHWNKLLKGSIVRWLCESGSRTPDDLDELVHPQGYAFDPLASEVGDRRAEVVMRAGPPGG